MAQQLTPSETEHARSIADPEPVLRPIPPKRITRILLASPVRKPPVVLEQLLRTIAWQVLPENVQLDVLFAPNYGDEPHKEEALALLTGSGLQIGHEVSVWSNAPVIAGDYGEATETRSWSKTAFTRLAALKNRILQHAMDEGYDFVWLLDADVMCDPWTLQSLLDTADHARWLAFEGVYRPPIVAGVYWTRWQRRNPASTDNVHAGPQVWLTHPYRLSGRGWTEADFRKALVERERVRVWGLGACTLIPVERLRHGVSFAPFEGLPPGPMSEGEDRHFCAWANAKHCEMIADGWPDIVHAYHPALYGELAEKVSKLNYKNPEYPIELPVRFGDLTSFQLEMLEPVIDGTGRVIRLGPKWVRGRYGALPVLPQVEEALGGLKRGQSKTVKLHFPQHWPEARLRLQSLVARVTLYDYKPFGLPPVIDEEFFVGGHSGRMIDHSTHTSEQLEEIAADG